MSKSVKLNQFNEHGVELYAGINGITVNAQANNFIRDKLIAENRKRLRADADAARKESNAKETI